MSNLVFEYKLTILESHLDSFGHVNNATYLEIFEEARWDFITKRGFGYKEVHRQQIGPTILDVYVNFKRELRLREDIVIETSCSNYEGKLGLITQIIKNNEGKVCTEAKFKVGLFDMKQRKLIAPTPQWLEAVGVNVD